MKEDHLVKMASLRQEAELLKQQAEVEKVRKELKELRGETVLLEDTKKVRIFEFRRRIKAVCLPSAFTHSASMTDRVQDGNQNSLQNRDGNQILKVCLLNKVFLPVLFKN